MTTVALQNTERWHCFVSTGLGLCHKCINYASILRKEASPICTLFVSYLRTDRTR